jgi:hypothetical protein
MILLSAEAEVMVQGAICDATKRVYTSIIHSYEEACSDIPGMTAWPATEQGLMNYLTFRGNYDKVKYKTVRNDLAALRYAMSQKGDLDPTRSQRFYKFMGGLRRTLHDDCETGMSPITGEILEKMCGQVNQEDL